MSIVPLSLSHLIFGHSTPAAEIDCLAAAAAAAARRGNGRGHGHPEVRLPSVRSRLRKSQWFRGAQESLRRLYWWCCVLSMCPTLKIC